MPEGHFSLNSETALNTRFVESKGMPSVSHSRISSSVVDSFWKDSTSPRSMAWKSDASSWKPSSRLRMILRNRLILAGEKRLRSHSVAVVARSLVRGLCGGAWNAVAREQSANAIRRASWVQLLRCYAAALGLDCTTAACCYAVALMAWLQIRFSNSVVAGQRCVGRLLAPCWQQVAASASRSIDQARL